MASRGVIDILVAILSVSVLVGLSAASHEDMLVI